MSLCSTRNDLHGTHLFSVLTLYSPIYLRPKGYSFELGLSTHPNSIKLNAGSHMVTMISGSWSEFVYEDKKPLEGASKEGWLVSVYLLPKLILPTLMEAQKKLSKL